MTRRLALDHLTVADLTPLDVAAVAGDLGFSGVCVFLESMSVLPRMPPHSLVRDPAQRRAFRSCLRSRGLTLDLAYPFTLSSRTQPGDHRASLEAAAEIGARAVNALLYDRDPARRVDGFAGFCDDAQALGLEVVVEFFPQSQVATLAAATSLILAAGRKARINVDILHLIRSGGAPADLRALDQALIGYAQLADGPAQMPVEEREYEASSERLLCGAGVFNLDEFVRALAPTLPISVEIPRDSALQAGASPRQRAAAALESARRTLADA